LYLRCLLVKIRTFPPPPNFVFRFTKCAAKKDVALVPPSRARATTRNSLNICC